jgi:DNA topoisomerase IB
MSRPTPIQRLLETTSMRLGNQDCAQSNKSRRITTFRRHHVLIHGRSITVDFTWQARHRPHIDRENAPLARIVGKCRHLPVRDLFRFIDNKDATRSVGSSDMREYVQSSGPRAVADEATTGKGDTLMVTHKENHTKHENKPASVRSGPFAGTDGSGKDRDRYSFLKKREHGSAACKRRGQGSA